MKQTENHAINKNIVIFLYFGANNYLNSHSGFFS